MGYALPPLNALRAFEATARLGSVTLAAQELNVTHSAISHQIKSLEAVLRVSLFRRNGRRLELSSQGAFLLPAATKAFSELASAAAALTQRTTAGMLRISCAQVWLSLWLMPRLHEFSAKYPDVQLVVTPSSNPQRIHSPESDVSVLYGDGDWANCWCALWSRFESFPVASPALVNRRPLRSLRDLRDHVLLHSDGGAQWNTWLAAAGVPTTLLRRSHRFHNARQTIEGALHGQGIALGDTVTTSRLVERGELIVPFPLKVSANQAIYVACRNEIRETPLVAAFIEWLFGLSPAGPSYAQKLQTP